MPKTNTGFVFADDPIEIEIPLVKDKWQEKFNDEKLKAINESKGGDIELTITGILQPSTQEEQEVKTEQPDTLRDMLGAGSSLQRLCETKLDKNTLRQVSVTSLTLNNLSQAEFAILPELIGGLTFIKLFKKIERLVIEVGPGERETVGERLKAKIRERLTHELDIQITQRKPSAPSTAANGSGSSDSAKAAPSEAQQPMAIDAIDANASEAKAQRKITIRASGVALYSRSALVSLRPAFSRPLASSHPSLEKPLAADSAAASGSASTGSILSPEFSALAALVAAATGSSSESASLGSGPQAEVANEGSGSDAMLVDANSGDDANSHPLQIGRTPPMTSSFFRPLQSKDKHTMHTKKRKGEDSDGDYNLNTEEFTGNDDGNPNTRKKAKVTGEVKSVEVTPEVLIKHLKFLVTKSASPTSTEEAIPMFVTHKKEGEAAPEIEKLWFEFFKDFPRIPRTRRLKGINGVANVKTSDKESGYAIGILQCTNALGYTIGRLQEADDLVLATFQEKFNKKRKPEERIDLNLLKTQAEHRIAPGDPSYDHLLQLFNHKNTHSKKTGNLGPFQRKDGPTLGSTPSLVSPQLASASVALMDTHSDAHTTTNGETHAHSHMPSPPHSEPEDSKARPLSSSSPQALSSLPLASALSAITLATARVASLSTRPSRSYGLRPFFSSPIPPRAEAMDADMMTSGAVQSQSASLTSSDSSALVSLSSSPLPRDLHSHSHSHSHPHLERPSSPQSGPDSDTESRSRGPQKSKPRSPLPSLSLSPAPVERVTMSDLEGLLRDGRRIWELQKEIKELLRQKQITNITLLDSEDCKVVLDSSLTKIACNHERARQTKAILYYEKLKRQISAPDASAALASDGSSGDKVDLDDLAAILNGYELIADLEAQSSDAKRYEFRIGTNQPKEEYRREEARQEQITGKLMRQLHANKSGKPQQASMMISRNSTFFGAGTPSAPQPHTPAPLPSATRPTLSSVAEGSATALQLAPSTSSE